MDIEFNFDYETAFRLLLSFIIGTAIGLEREYHSKAAGLRTMIMICLGSTIFTLVSTSIGGPSPDRIASNIITGIGFLGAGVIFKDGLTITGITTATTIWISAALGMAVGTGLYFIALTGSVIVLVVLVLLQKIQRFIEMINQARSYKITCNENGDFISSFERELKQLKLSFEKKRDMKDSDNVILIYEINGRAKKLDVLNDFLKADARVKTFEY